MENGKLMTLKIKLTLMPLGLLIARYVPLTLLLGHFFKHLFTI